MLTIAKGLFKSTWLVFGLGQLIILIIHWFNWSPDYVGSLTWWERLSPLIWIAFWALLWFLSAWFNAGRLMYRNGKRERFKSRLGTAMERQHLLAAGPNDPKWGKYQARIEYYREQLKKLM